MKPGQITAATLDFLTDLDAHNDRDWFQAHKGRYLTAQENMEQFVRELLVQMQAHDQIAVHPPKRVLHRIYADVRFSREKLPYKPRFAGYIGRLKPLFRGGYYFSIKPGASMIGCGFWGPNPEDMRRIRTELAADPEELRGILKDKGIQRSFGAMQGEQLRTVPQGYPRDHAAADLLRFKQYLFTRSIPDAEVMVADFAARVSGYFRDLRPFLNYMTAVLTTNANGESLF